MSVQNGERPRWAWSGLQHGTEPASETAAADSDGAVEETVLIGVEPERPSWAWGAEPAVAAASTPPAPAPPVPEVTLTEVEPAAQRPAWSWGGPAA